MSQNRKNDSLWLAATQIKGIRFAAIAAKKPQSSKFRLNRMKFRSISLNDLDDLYKLGKQHCMPEASPDWRHSR
jgi:hypothetical protein